MFSSKLYIELRLVYCLFLIVLFIGCSGSSPEEEHPEVLSNLVVSVEVYGINSSSPYGDGSGKITVSFSAMNATSYRVNFGNGETIETESTTLDYTYIGAGTNTYMIYVSAYNAGKFISQEQSLVIYVAPSMTWSDEFNINGEPDNSKWGYDIGNSGWGNNESQYYTSRSDNVIVEDGMLKITAKKENFEGALYTSARIKTQGKFKFKYGRVEVRAKLPAGGGTWPAIWMLGSNISSVGWPACGEIDIMEHIGNEMGRVHSSLHTPSSYGATTNSDSIIIEDVSSAFHIYEMEWTAQKIEFFIDGQSHYTYSPSTKNNDTWPFDRDQFIILNVAMGGNFGGTIDPDFTSGTMEIDYIRVYQ